MNRVLVIWAISVLSSSLSAQVSPTSPKAARVRIIQGPKIELAKEHLTIINWTTNNPGGSPVHYGIVHYGTDPHNLIETAKSPIRLNADHSSTIFRVRLDDLKPETTYYYTVGSMQATGESDGANSSVNHFTTP
ncbi:MAG: fibronectin type III domain-containing protein [Terracidiphilus sp.]